MSTQTRNDLREQDQTDTAGGGLPLVYHDCCPDCYPEPYPGMSALCGQQLLGLTATEGVPCPLCFDVEECPECGFPIKYVREFWFGRD